MHGHRCGRKPIAGARQGNILYGRRDEDLQDSGCGSLCCSLLSCRAALLVMSSPILLLLLMTSCCPVLRPSDEAPGPAMLRTVLLVTPTYM